MSTIHSRDGRTARAKRLGRGPGSGRGTTSGYGHKGAKSRSGRKRKAYFEGGQNPISVKVPKRGFNNKRFRKEYQVVNLAAIARIADQADVIDRELLLQKRIVRSAVLPLKVLGNGELDKEVTVRAHKFSKTARQKIEDAHGKAEDLV